MNPAPNKGQSLRGQVIDWHFRLEAAPDDEALRAEFDAWLAENDRHRKAYETIRSIWHDAEQLPPAAPEHQRPADVVPLRHARPRTRRLYYLAALAACLAILMLPTIRLRLAADHMTGVAELRELVLDDGSRVTLDADSAIAVDLSTKQRSVTLLSGQAFFEVVPLSGRPFVVTASDVTVTVVGTSFNVGTSDTGVAVAVETGKVDVRRDGKELAGLAAGERLRIKAEGTAAQESVNPGDAGAWRNQRLIVHEATVREVVEQIGRYVPGMIIFRDRQVADRRVSGVIDLRRPEEALRDVVNLQRGEIMQISPYLTVISAR